MMSKYRYVNRFINTEFKMLSLAELKELQQVIAKEIDKREAEK